MIITRFWYSNKVFLCVCSANFIWSKCDWCFICVWTRQPKNTSHMHSVTGMNTHRTARSMRQDSTSSICYFNSSQIIITCLHDVSSRKPYRSEAIFTKREVLGSQKVFWVMLTVALSPQENRSHRHLDYQLKISIFHGFYASLILSGLCNLHL